MLIKHFIWQVIIEKIKLVWHKVKFKSNLAVSSPFVSWRLRDAGFLSLNYVKLLAIFSMSQLDATHLLFLFFCGREAENDANPT